MGNREKANVILRLCEAGMLDPQEVLTNVLTNYMSSDQADDFAESEYGDWFDDNDNN